MLTTIPFDSEAELKSLLPLGGDEFYCGVLQPGSLPNKRSLFTPANLRDFRELSACCRLAGGSGRKVFVCFNTYTLDQAEDGIRLAVEAGASGVILADHTLAPVVRKNHPSCKIIISTLNPVFNGQALRYFRELGADRVVLERQLTLGEIDALNGTAAGIGLELEVFVLNSACRFVNGSCLLHQAPVSGGFGMRQLSELSPLPDWQPCSRLSALKVTGAAGGAAACGSGLDMDAGLRHYCGLCALFPLHRSGLAAAKVVGRGYPSAKKLLDIGLISRYSGMIRDGGINADNFIGEGRKLYASVYGRPCEARECHYLEILRKRGRAGA